MAKKAKNADNPFFVGVHDPIEIRRAILESSKETIHLMQQFETFKNLRDEKKKLIEELRLDLKNIQVLVNKLKKLIPKTKLRIALHADLQKLTDDTKALKQKAKDVNQKNKKSAKSTKKLTKSKSSKNKPLVKKKQEIPEIELPQEEKVEKNPKKLTEIERLEKELSAIEGRLGKI